MNKNKAKKEDYAFFSHNLLQQAPVTINGFNIQW